MNKRNLFIAVLAAGTIALSGCSKKEGSLIVNIEGLPNLGPNYAYEGWLTGNGDAKTAGIFTVNDAGEMSSNMFDIKEKDIDKAKAYILTIEPYPDSDPKPSSVHIIGGDFNGSTATLSVAHGTALGNDFTSATGNYILATPTDGGSGTDELSGVWWLDPATGPGPGLTLPGLPSGWTYEGWAVIDGIPVTTGKFLSATGADQSSPYSGPVPGPPFPGEDFLTNAPAGLTFPTDLSGKTVVISIEPNPDNSPMPFSLKPLVGNVPNPATDHMLYQMTNNAAATNPTGTVSR
ncbi:hypothetical protein ACFLS7_02405 [Bacteroidota bacterium]